jgi:hypothetical protein
MINMKITIIGMTILVLAIFLPVNHVYAPCLTGPGINCNNYQSQTLSQVKTDKISYESLDKPVITVSGSPYVSAHLEVYDSPSNIVSSHDITLSSNGTALYVLDISSYKPGVYSVVATSMMSKITTSFAVGLVSSGGGIMSLQTTKDSYFPGDSVKILGAYNPNTIIGLSLLDPNDLTVQSTQTISDKTGHFTYSGIQVPTYAMTGIWKIQATSGVARNTIQIKVASPMVSGTTSYGGLTGYRIANFKSEHTTYPIWYKIQNGTVISTPLDLSAKALLFFIDATNNGRLTVELPRSIIDSKNQNDDKPFFVSAYTTDTGVSKVDAIEVNDTYVRTLEINFTKSTTEVEIVGNLFVEKHTTKSLGLMAPLFQVRSGIKATDVICKSNFQLILKAIDGSPACVRPESVNHLIQMGWARQASYYHDMHVQPKITLNDYAYGGIDTDSNTTVSINNNVYYQTTISYSAYNLPQNMQLKFHNVTFTFPDGTIVTPGGSTVLLDIKFNDGFEETYGSHTEHELAGIPVPTQYGPHQAVNSTTILSNHMRPQAGMTIFHDKIRLLVSVK